MTEKIKKYRAEDLKKWERDFDDMSRVLKELQKWILYTTFSMYITSEKEKINALNRSNVTPFHYYSFVLQKSYLCILNIENNRLHNIL